MRTPENSPWQMQWTEKDSWDMYMVCAGQAGAVCEAAGSSLVSDADPPSVASASSSALYAEAHPVQAAQQLRRGHALALGMRQTSLLRIPRDLELVGTWTAGDELQLAATATEVLERFGAFGRVVAAGPVAWPVRVLRHHCG